MSNIRETSSIVIPELNTQGLQGERGTQQTRSNIQTPVVQQQYQPQFSSQSQDYQYGQIVQNQNQPQFFPGQQQQYPAQQYQAKGRGAQRGNRGRGRAKGRGGFLQSYPINDHFNNHHQNIGQQSPHQFQDIAQIHEEPENAPQPTNAQMNNSRYYNQTRSTPYNYGYYPPHHQQYQSQQKQYYDENNHQIQQNYMHNQYYYPQYYQTNHQENMRGQQRGRGRGRPQQFNHDDQTYYDEQIDQQMYHTPQILERNSQPPLPKTQHSQINKPKYTIHRRQYGTNNNNNTADPIGETEEVVKEKKVYQSTNENEQYSNSSHSLNQENNKEHKHKIVQRSGNRGRGKRQNQQYESHGDNGYSENYNRREGEDQSTKSTRNYNNSNREQTLTEEAQFQRENYNHYQTYDEEDGFNEDSSFLPEYLRYGDDDYSQQYPKARGKNTPNATYRIKTFDDEEESENSFDELREGEDRSGHTHARKGPKLIKFKQKKPSERLALSQIKSEQSADNQNNQNYDAFIPKNKQSTEIIEILRPYKGFEQPKFYQGPSWKYVRQSTNQNSKQKHYENGEYDNVQYNYPGAELEDKEGTDGEQKLYPPIDDYSDEDLGAGISKKFSAKISFNKTSKQLEKERKGEILAKINIMKPNVDQPNPKVFKKQGPTVNNKLFTLDQAKANFTLQQQTVENLLIQGLPDSKAGDAKGAALEGAITMDAVENFFIKEPEEVANHRQNNTNFFEKYNTDAANISKGLEKGIYYKGVVRMNPKFRHRAYVSIPELDVDVLVEGYKLMNRSMDGDSVLIEMMPVHSWIEMSEQNTLLAKVTTLCQTTGIQQQGISHLIKGGPDNQAYTNEAAIESRTIDNEPKNNLLKPSVQQSKDTDQLSQSFSQSEDDSKAKISQKDHDVILNKLRPKKTVRNPVGEEGGGYVASSSDNNLELRRDKKTHTLFCRSRKESGNLAVMDNKESGTQKLSDSNNSSDAEDAQLLVTQNEQSAMKNIFLDNTDEQDLWENLEHAGKNENDANLSDPETPMPRLVLETKKDQDQERAMTVAEFLGQTDATDPSNQDENVKQSSYKRKELHGLKADRISQINAYGKDFRPLAKVIGLVSSTNRDTEQMVTLVEIARDLKQDPLVFAVPLNEKLPWFIVTDTPAEYTADKHADRNPRNRYYVTSFEDWRTTQRRPHCKVIRSIGEAGNLQAESMRILIENDICTEQYENDNEDVTSNVHECLKPFSRSIDPKTNEWEIPGAELSQRLDLRQKRIFTIDPVTARDLDDALSIEQISDNIYEIGVHIADVSYFVSQGTSLDKEALKRGTSTYFVHQVYPMLPRLLCERLCSLNPNVDRLTYSIFYRMDLNGDVDKSFKPVVKRSVIKSCAKWTYQLAQDIIDGKLETEEQLHEEYKPKGHKFADMAQDILVMNGIAQARRKKRFEAGSIEFVNREFNFTLNPDTLYPVSWQEAPKMQSKQLVEEYMLLANILIAEFLFSTCQDKTLLRAHNEIKEQTKEKLASFFQKCGLNVDISTALSLSKSLEQLKKEKDSEDRLQVVNRQFLTHLTQAKYVCVESHDAEDLSHYGLNFEIYTHFTSPIRRYADLLVHRLLTIALKEGPDTRSKLDGLDYSEYAEQISEKSYNARKASKSCQTLFHCMLLKEHGERVFDSLVFNLESHQMGIYVHELGMHFQIKLRDDVRVDQTTFFEDQLQVVISFKTPQALAPGLRGYLGASELRMSHSQKKKEMEMKRISDDRQDLVRRLMTQNDTTEVDQERIAQTLKDQGMFTELKSNCVFSIFDKIKVKLYATDTFPMKIECKLMITEDDMADYNRILQSQSEKLPQLQMITDKENLKAGHVQESIHTHD